MGQLHNCYCSKIFQTWDIFPWAIFVSHQRFWWAILLAKLLWRLANYQITCSKNIPQHDNIKHTGRLHISYICGEYTNFERAKKAINFANTEQHLHGYINNAWFPFAHAVKLLSVGKNYKNGNVAMNRFGDTVYNVIDRSLHGFSLQIYEACKGNLPHFKFAKLTTNVQEEWQWQD